jgi:hypothetical protein
MLRRWSEWEERFIRDNYQKLPIGEIVKALGRTEKATRNKVERMGIRLPGLGANKWSAKEIAVLEESFRAGKGDMEIAELLRRSKQAVSAQRARRGLYRYRRGDGDGKYLDADGYFKIYDGDGRRLFYHRVVAERMLGRKLKPEERIHHINFDKTNNREENLYVCRDRSHHFRVHFQGLEILGELVKRGVVSFNKDKGEYEICEKKSYGQV